MTVSSRLRFVSTMVGVLGLSVVAFVQFLRLMMVAFFPAPCSQMLPGILIVAETTHVPAGRTSCVAEALFSAPCNTAESSETPSHFIAVA